MDTQTARLCWRFAPSRSRRKERCGGLASKAYPRRVAEWLAAQEWTRLMPVKRVQADGLLSGPLLATLEHVRRSIYAKEA